MSRFEAVSPNDWTSLQRNFVELDKIVTQGLLGLIRFTPRVEPQVTEFSDRVIPVGYTYFDSSSLKVRTWDGSVWKDHW